MRRGENGLFRMASVVVSGVDSMAARAAIWSQVKAGSARWYIDARMGGRVLRVFTVDMSNREQRQEYRRSIISDAVADDAPCTERSIVYTPMLCAALVCDNVTKIVRAEVPPFDEEWDFVTRTHL